MSENNRFTSKFGKSIHKISFGEIKDNSRFQAEFINTSGSSDAFTGMITKWTVTADDLDVNLHGQEATTFNYDVDWGDGQEETGITSDNKTHTYASEGTYTVKISGQFGGFRMGGSTTQSALVEFVQWGTETTIEALYQMFSGCGNMVYSATDNPTIVLNSGASYDNRIDQMFRYCTSVTSLNLSGWSIGNANLVVYGTYCFDGCTNLEYLNISNWSFTNANQFQYFFRNVGNLTTNGCELIWNDGGGDMNNLQYLFQNAKLTSLTMNNFTLTNTGISLNNICSGVEFLDESLDLSGWSGTSGITNLTYAFRNMNLTSTTEYTLNLSGWNTSNVTTMYGLCYDNRYLTDIIGLSDLRGGSLVSTGFNRVFYRNYALTFNTYNFHDDFGSGWSVTDCNSAFYQVAVNSTLGSDAPNMTNWDMNVITGFNSFFRLFKFKASTSFTMFDLSSATDISQMFFYTQGITDIDMSNSNMSNTITSLVNFVRNSDVETVDFSNCDFSAVTTLSHFAYCCNISSLTFDATVSFASLDYGSNFLSTACGGGGMTTAEYDAFLVRLDTTGLTGAYSINFGTSQYTIGGAGETARSSLVTKGWTITDGGGV